MTAMVLIAITAVAGWLVLAWAARHVRGLNDPVWPETPGFRNDRQQLMGDR